jgi:hypothetical protein
MPGRFCVRYAAAAAELAVRVILMLDVTASWYSAVLGKLPSISQYQQYMHGV